MVNWMNKRPPKGFSYTPTNAEHIANIFTHGMMIPAGVLASIILMMRSATFGLFFMAVIYGICLVTLFSVSTAFHTAFYYQSNIKLIEMLRKSDRAVIYLFIAASYCPWLFLVSTHGHCLITLMRWLIWLLAFLGVSFELTVSRRYPMLGIMSYVVYGAIPALILHSQLSFPGLYEMKFAGAMYLIGVLFFKSEGIVPFAHAIWHICVILGASIHYLTVYSIFYANLDDTTLPLTAEGI